MDRIQLKPGLQLVSRGPATVQLGLDSRHGTVLDGLTGADVALLHALVDGVDVSTLTAPPVERPGPDDPAGPAGGAGVSSSGEAGTPSRVRRLLDTLDGAGLLLRSRTGRTTTARLGEVRSRLGPDAAAWSLVHPDTGDGWGLLADRRCRAVEIHGSGRTGLALATLLAATGVGRVGVVDPAPTSPADLLPGGAHPADVGAARSVAARGATDRALGRPVQPGAMPAGALQPGTVPARPRASRRPPAGPSAPDLVVLVDRSAADATRADRWLADDIAHLSVVIRETSVVVGPLVRPGHGPCLRCLDLHRSDRDRQWPMILAQLLSRRSRGRAPREESAIAQLAASVAALQVLGHLDGRAVPAAAGATLEAELPDGLVSRRPWPAHPACGCHWPPPADHVTGLDAHERSPAATMLR